MKLRYALLLPVLSASLLLAGCGKGKSDQGDKGEDDPALTGALGDQIMVDPDLAGQNRGNAAISGGGPANGELPPEQKTPEAIAAARSEAARLSGGVIQSAPAPVASAAATGGVTAAETALSVPASLGENCPDKVEYAMSWVSRLPATFPVYPRGHVQEAAGTDKDGCRLRVVNYVTPVAVKDVIDFYYTRARSAGYDAEYALSSGETRDHVLGGSKDVAAYVVYVRTLANGLTEVDLVANGG